MKIIFFSPPFGARELKLRPFDSESKTTSDCSNSLFSKKITPNSLSRKRRQSKRSTKFSAHRVSHEPKSQHHITNIISECVFDDNSLFSGHNSVINDLLVIYGSYWITNYSSVLELTEMKSVSLKIPPSSNKHFNNSKRK